MGRGLQDTRILTDSFYAFAHMMHLGNYRSERTSLGTFPTKPWSDDLSTSPLLKLPPHHFFTLCHAHSAVLLLSLRPCCRPVLVKEIGNWSTPLMGQQGTPAEKRPSRASLSLGEQIPLIPSACVTSLMS